MVDTDTLEKNAKRIEAALQTYRDELSLGDECLGMLGDLFHMNMQRSDGLEEAEKGVQRQLRQFNDRWGLENLPAALKTALEVEGFLKGKIVSKGASR